MDMTDATHEFGPYAVTLLQDGVFEPPSDMLVHGGGEEKLAQAKAAIGPTLHLEVNCFLVRGPNGVTLIDSGIGAAWGPSFGHARAALAAAGVEPAQVDRVLVTHLHGDHVMGLLDGESAYFPRAEIFVPAEDLAYFTDEAERAAQPEDRRAAFDTAKTLQSVYAGRMHTLTPGPVPGMEGVELIALPGHTPGHSGYLFHGPQTLLMWADTVHVRAPQLADPELGLSFDVDRAQGRQTRRDTLARAAREGWIVAGSHVAGFGKIEEDGEAFRFVA